MRNDAPFWWVIPIFAADGVALLFFLFNFCQVASESQVASVNNRPVCQATGATVAWSGESLGRRADVHATCQGRTSSFCFIVSFRANTEISDEGRFTRAFFRAHLASLMRFAYQFRCVLQSVWGLAFCYGARTISAGSVSYENVANASFLLLFRYV